MILKEKSQDILRELTQMHELIDITIEEDDVGSVVERIYSSRKDDAHA